MKYIKLGALALVGFIVFSTLSLDPNDEPQIIYAQAAQAASVGAEVSPEPLKPLNDTNSSYDCRGYKIEISRPDYVPEDSLRGALCASEIFGVPVEYIIAVQQLECNFGQSNAQDIRNKNKTCRDQGTKNGCSAAGPGQFIAQTWDKRNQNGKCNRRAQEIREGSFGDLKEPAKHAGVPGYGMDCDADGLANPWSVLDAACATAHYLSALNASYNDWFKVFMHYNGGPRGDRSRTIPYANGVVARAETFKNSVLTK